MLHPDKGRSHQLRIDVAVLPVADEWRTQHLSVTAWVDDAIVGQFLTRLDATTAEVADAYHADLRVAGRYLVERMMEALGYAGDKDRYYLAKPIDPR